VRIVQELRRAGERLETEGVRLSVALLGEDAAPVRDLSAAGMRAALQPALASEAPDALLLVGGDDVVPFFRSPNPVRDRGVDPDPFVLSDAPYGAPRTPGIPVGRIPDAAVADLEGLLSTLDGLGRRRNGVRHGLLAIANGEWVESARAVVHGHGASLRVAPGWTAANPEWRTSRPAWVYFNVHGFDDVASWRAMNDDTGTWQDVLTPALVTPDTGRGAFVFSEACYGASVVGKTATTSIALAFLRAQCRGFVGATGLAFGSYTVSLRPQFADAVAGHFLDKVAAGHEFGAALMSAQAVARSESASSTFLEKTAQQFVLFGNPLATL
jgi:hypothetical protein